MRATMNYGPHCASLSIRRYRSRLRISINHFGRQHRQGLVVEQTRRFPTSLTGYENLSGNCFANALVSVSAMR